MKVIEKIVGMLAILILVPCAILVIIIVGSSIFGKTFKNAITEEPTSEVMQTTSQEESAAPEEPATGAPMSETAEPASAASNAPITETGAGTFYITTPDGTSENGNIPVITLEKDATLIQIGIETIDLNANNLSYVFIDGFFVKKEQFTNSQSVIDLIDNSLTPGTHNVEIFQYENDNENANVLTHKSASYEIKPVQ